MSDSVMTVHEDGTKFWKNKEDQFHRINGPAIERANGSRVWFVNGEWLGRNDKGFWNLWHTLTPEQKKDQVLLTYLPGDFNV